MSHLIDNIDNNNQLLDNNDHLPDNNDQLLNNNDRHPRISIVALSTPNRFDFSNAVAQNQQKYAARYGYGYFRYTASLDPTRPEEWSKILALLDQMQTSQAEWLVWIDDDILFTNPHITFEMLIEQYASFTPETINLIIAHDAYHERGVPINNGIFLIRNCLWSQQFLITVWIEGARRGYLIRGQSLLEQQTMTELMMEDANVFSKVKIVSQRVMNAFSRYPGYNDPEDSRWRPGDFVVHVTGMFPEDRKKRIEGFLLQGDEPWYVVD